MSPIRQPDAKRLKESRSKKAEFLKNLKETHMPFWHLCSVDELNAFQDDDKCLEQNIVPISKFKLLDCQKQEYISLVKVKDDTYKFIHKDEILNAEQSRFISLIRQYLWRKSDAADF